nr:uncharacterized protein LOC127303733 [Lolium perenne]
MPMDWEWGSLPLSSTNPPTPEARERRNEALAASGTWTRWTRIHTCTGPNSRWAEPTLHALVVEHAAPLQAEVGQEFLERLTSQGKKNKAPVPEAGSSVAPPAKRARQEIGGKVVTTKRYRKREMPVASGAALNLTKSATGMRPKNSEEAAQASPPPQVPPVPKKKKKKTPASSPSKTVPDSSAPASSAPAKNAPEAPTPPKTASTPPPARSTGEPATIKPTPSEGTKFIAQQLAAVVTTASSPSSGSQSLVLHTGRATVAAGETASAQLGQITELSRGGADLGHLLDYAKKWNQADLSPATLGLGKDKLPVVDPAGPRSIGQHFGCLRRAVKEFDTAWHDANNNVVLSALKAEKEQLVLAHRKALDAQEAISAKLKEQLMQAELRHDQERKEDQAAAEAKLDESLKEFTDNSVVLRAELEEETRARKAAPDRIATLTTDQAEYDRLVMQTDALALRLFPDSQPHAHKKVMERRTEQAMSNPEAAWDAYDHLVALSTRIQHMRVVDRHLVDLPDVAIQIFKVLWPGEEVPANLSLTSECLKDAGRRIREWQLRGDAPTDKDPVLTAKRKNRAYRIAEYAPIRTFIPPPPDVRDTLTDDEGEEDEEDEDVGEGDAPPEAGGAPPEAPEASDAPPEAPVA